MNGFASMRRNGAVVVLACAAVLASGCATPGKQRESDFAEFVSLLPGSYETEAEGASPVDGQRGPQQEGRALTLVPVYAPRLAQHVFYAHETAAGDPRRVLDQRLLAFALTKQGTIVQSTWMLTDPPRWRSAREMPDLFKGLMPQDVRPLTGCDLQWTRDAGAAAAFSGRNDPGTCRLGALHTGALAPHEMRAELGDGTLALGTRAVSAAAELSPATSGGWLLRYVKHAP
jgi:hypothetical protein